MPFDVVTVLKHTVKAVIIKLITVLSV